MRQDGWDPRTDGWFSGFADGEACFVISRRGDRRTGFSVRFQLTLRSDDLAILEARSGVFGGTVRVRSHATGNPQAHWVVSAKRDLGALMHYFDQFPLRAKKANDYAIWRRAVRVVLAKGAGFPELGDLADALRAGRAFDATPPLDAPVGVPQLRLIA